MGLSGDLRGYIGGHLEKYKAALQLKFYLHNNINCFHLVLYGWKGLIHQSKPSVHLKMVYNELKYASAAILNFWNCKLMFRIPQYGTGNHKLSFEYYFFGIW